MKLLCMYMISICKRLHLKASTCNGWMRILARVSLPDAAEIAEAFKRLMEKRYPDASLRPTFNQELWEQASVVKKNYVKGQGPRRLTVPGSCSSNTRSTQSSYHPTAFNVAQCVDEICKDPTLIRQLFDHLKTMNPNDTASQGQNNEESRQ